MEMLEQAVQLGERAEPSPTRGRWARFMDARAEQLQRGVHADRAGRGRRRDRARHPGGSDGFAASMRGAPFTGPRRRGHPPGPGSTSKTPMRRVESERPRLRRTGLSDAAKAGEPAYPLGPRLAGPRQGLTGGCAPSDPPNGNGTSWTLDRAGGSSPLRLAGPSRWLIAAPSPPADSLPRTTSDSAHDRALDHADASAPVPA